MPKVCLSYRLMIGLTLVVGVGASVLLAAGVNQWELAKRQQRFQRQTENLTTALQRSLNRYTDLLAFLGDYYVVQAPAIDRAAFATFVRRSLRNHPGIQALEWAPLVSQADRMVYEQTLKTEGYLGFQITELGREGQLVRAGTRPEYVPVTYVEPWVGNESALGYDLSSNPIRAAAIVQAKKTGKIQATGRIRLVQERRDQFGFLVFQPLYQSVLLIGDRVSQEKEKSHFTGVLVGVFRVADVVEESLDELRYEIDFSLYDRSAQSGEEFLGRYEASQKQVIMGEMQFSPNRQQLLLCPLPETCTRTLSVGQRQWSIIFVPSENYVIDVQYGSIIVLIIGLFLTTGLVLFLYQLNQELEHSQSLSQLRNRFFSMASHELRTPLSTILVSSESLQLNYNYLNDEQKQASLQRIYNTAKRMHQQISDLLLLTRAEVGKLDFNPELIELQPFLQKIIDEMQMSISQLILFDSPPGSTTGFLDKHLLRSLVTNLLTNAAKYSPPQAPIQVTLTSDFQWLTLQMQDQGIGIPKADLLHIGNTFYRASNVGDVIGSGLGLAVVKASVELHRGQWTITSQEGQGTTITVRLPLE